jgi:hypothetical protein
LVATEVLETWAGAKAAAEATAQARTANFIFTSVDRNCEKRVKRQKKNVWAS